MDGKGNWQLAAGRTTIYAIFSLSFFSGPERITELLSANPQYGKPQRELLRCSGARDRQGAPPILEGVKSR